MEKQGLINFSEGAVWFDPVNRITRVELLPGTRQTLAHAKEQIATIREVNGGERRPLLADLRNAKSTDKDARAYFASEASKSVWTAVAMLTGTPLSNAIANVWIGANQRNDVAMKLFTSETEAIAWLKGFVQ